MFEPLTPSPWLRVALAMVAASCAQAAQPASAAQAVRPHLASLPAAPVLLAKLCGAGGHDRVTRYFCATPTPAPKSLVELELGLGLDPKSVQFALTANSTAATVRAVNPLNPRAILFDGMPRPYLSQTEFLALGFTRGEQVVELATRDELTHQLRFFLVEFSQPCNAGEACDLDALLTPKLERDWVALRVMQDSDLANTALDCLRCHEPNGPGTTRLLRMQEFSAPWTHFLAPASESTSGAQLVQDFRTAHPPSEPWAGLPGSRLERESQPLALSSLVAQESTSQPNFFPSFPISLEVASTGRSPTWEALADTARRGDAIPVPFWGLRVTDEQRQAEAAAAYARVFAGQAPVEDLVDLRALQSLEAERAMSIRPTEGASGEQLLVEACQHCHHSKLDQSLSRARFQVDHLVDLSADERATAIERLRLEPSDVRKMPPVIAGELTADEIERAAATLRGR